MTNLIKKGILTIATLFVLVGCGAKSDLEDMGISYNPDDYFKYGVYKKDIAILDLFYDAGMPVETVDKDGDTALDNAIYKGHFELIKFLVEEHKAEIKDESISVFIRKKFRGEKKDEEIIKYLFDKGAKLTEKGVRGLDRYYTFSRTMDPTFILMIAKNGMSKKASTYRLARILMEFDNYVRRERRFSKTSYDKINETANNLLPLINQLITNGADVKEAYSKLDIPVYSSSLDKNNWIKTFIKVMVDKGKIDINNDTVLLNHAPALIPVVLGFQKLEDIKETVIYLLKNGANPAIRAKGAFRGGNKNAIDAFCTTSTDLKRPNSFYPEICQSKTYNIKLFKLLFTDTEKYEKLKAESTNLIKAHNAYKKKKFTNALKLYIPYAEKGNLIAQEKVADLFNGKKGIKKDIKKSAYWYEKAAEQGSNKAQYYTGTHYEFGAGVIKDKIKAKSWYEKAYKSSQSSKNKKMIKKRIDKL